MIANHGVRCFGRGGSTARMLGHGSSSGRLRIWKWKPWSSISSKTYISHILRETFVPRTGLEFSSWTIYSTHIFFCSWGCSFPSNIFSSLKCRGRPLTWPPSEKGPLLDPANSTSIAYISNIFTVFPSQPPLSASLTWTLVFDSYSGEAQGIHAP